MATNELSVIEIKLAEPQIDFLEKKAKELGLSKEELIKRYISEAINEENGKTQTLQEKRLAHIQSVKGKYASVLSSSEDFAKRKQEEIQMER